MTGRLVLLIAACGAFWLLAGLPARLLGGGDAALTYSGTALLVCLVPAVLTLAWAGRALRGAPDQQLVAILGGTGLRLFFVLGVAWLLYSWVPHYREREGFWVWLLVAYLFTLAVELALLLAGRAHESATRHPTAAGPSAETQPLTPRR
jgi:hypothetical protein